MSRTKRSSKLSNFRKLNVSPKSHNQQLESSKDQGLHTSKIVKYSGDDFDVAAWSEKLQIQLRYEDDGTTSYYFRRNLIVNLTEEEKLTFDFKTLDKLEEKVNEKRKRT